MSGLRQPGAWQAEPRLTYFEILTVMALFLFRESGVQCAVMEAGLGARYDATTATLRISSATPHSS